MRITLDELSSNPDALIRLAEDGPVTITSGDHVVGRYIPVDDELASPDHARDAAGMFRHLVKRPVLAEHIEAASHRRR